MSLLIKAFAISSPSGVVGPSTPEFDGGRDDDWELDPEPVASSPCPGCQVWEFGGWREQSKRKQNKWSRALLSCYLTNQKKTIGILSQSWHKRIRKVKRGV